MKLIDFPFWTKNMVRRHRSLYLTSNQGQIIVYDAAYKKNQQVGSNIMFLLTVFFDFDGRLTYKSLALGCTISTMKILERQALTTETVTAYLDAMFCHR